LPHVKEANVVKSGTVGLDLNISNVAYVADTWTVSFAEQVPTLEREISAIQRQMQRQERTANPDNYEPDFQSRKGRKTVTKKGRSKREAQEQV